MSPCARPLLIVLLLLSASRCADPATPASPSDDAAVARPGSAEDGQTAAHAGHTRDKGYIDGWLDGQDVQLYYTKSFFCAEPPSSDAATNCEIGAAPEVAPRPGEVPTIYALAAAGIQPDPSTLACIQGSPCLNHPAMIDASRVGGRANGPALSHSHVLSKPGGGWFRTVNIRVFSLAAWNQIAEAKTLAKVRELQGGNPSAGVPGVISADTPTNIYFFIAGARP